MQCPGTQKKRHSVSRHSKEAPCSVPVLKRSSMQCPGTQKKCQVVLRYSKHHWDASVNCPGLGCKCVVAKLLTPHGLISYNPLQVVWCYSTDFQHWHVHPHHSLCISYADPLVRNNIVRSLCHVLQGWHLTSNIQNSLEFIADLRCVEHKWSSKTDRLHAPDVSGAQVFTSFFSWPHRSW
jgi:hypothetical protein